MVPVMLQLANALIQSVDRLLVVGFQGREMIFEEHFSKGHEVLTAQGGNDFLHFSLVNLNFGKMLFQVVAQVFVAMPDDLSRLL